MHRVKARQLPPDECQLRIRSLKKDGRWRFLAKPPGLCLGVLTAGMS